MKEGAWSQLICPRAILAAVCNWIIEIRGERWHARSLLPIQTQKTTPAPTGLSPATAKPSRVSGPLGPLRRWKALGALAPLRGLSQQNLKLATGVGGGGD